jgi:hypothetical protein
MHGPLDVKFLNKATDTITLSQSPALTILHGLPDPEDRDTTVLMDVSKHLSGSTVSHPRSKKYTLFSSIFTNSNQIQELVTLMIEMKTYGYFKSTFSKVWLHHINQILKTVRAAISANDLLSPY